LFIITYIVPLQWRSVAVMGHANFYVLITDWLNEMNWQTMERFAILAGLTTISKLNPGLFEVNGAGHGNRSIGSHAYG